MPLAILWTNLSEHRVSDKFRQRLITLLAKCARKSANGTGLVVHTDCKCSLGLALHEPVVFLLFKASGPALNQLDNAEHADRICALLRAELGIPVHRVVIQFEQLDRGEIGFCGTTKLELDRKAEQRSGMPLRKNSLGFFYDNGNGSSPVFMR